MAEYLLIESRDPFESNEVRYSYDLAKGLAEDGNQVTLVADDVDDRGIDHGDLVPGVQLLPRKALPGLLAEYALASGRGAGVSRVIRAGPDVGGVVGTDGIEVTPGWKAALGQIARGG